MSAQGFLFNFIKKIKNPSSSSLIQHRMLHFFSQWFHLPSLWNIPHSYFCECSMHVLFFSNLSYYFNKVYRGRREHLPSLDLNGSSAEPLLLCKLACPSSFLHYPRTLLPCVQHLLIPSIIPRKENALWDESSSGSHPSLFFLQIHPSFCLSMPSFPVPSWSGAPLPASTDAFPMSSIDGPWLPHSLA